MSVPTHSIQKPIFIISAGRSGSTAFLRLLSNHPDLIWLTGFAERYPDQPFVSRSIFRLMRFPLIGNILQKRLKPWECYPFWNRYYKGFSRPFRDLVAEDVTQKVKHDLRSVFSQLVLPNRDRMLIKITGWPRIGFLREVFPDAKFIHMVRDGRAVVNSILNVDFWKGWEGPAQWRWGALTVEEMQVWTKHNQSFIALAAMEWNRLIAATRDASHDLSQNQFMEVRYEDLCQNQFETIKRVTAFCELKPSDPFAKDVLDSKLTSANYKWKEDLTPQQQVVLEEILAENLKAYGYKPHV